MQLEWFIAKRYLWSKRRHPFVGVMSAVSVIGISVGVAALIVVLAVMNGFDEDLRDRIIGMRSHLVIQKEGGVNQYQALLAGFKKAERVTGAAPYVEGQALIQNGDWAQGVLVRGIDVKEEAGVSKFTSYLKEGALAEDAQSVVIGSEIAKKFALSQGAEFFIVTPSTHKPLKYHVTGIFSSGMYDYDANIVFLNLDSAQKLFEMPQDTVSGLSVMLKNPQDAAKVKHLLQSKLKYPFYVLTWMDLNKALFGALKLEKAVMFLILALIILVASLNIAGSLTVMVIDKTKDIGVLKALGATSMTIAKIFGYGGLLIGGLGTAIGVIFGGVICFVLKNYSIIDLPKDIYYFDKLPVRLSPGDIGAIIGVAILLSLLSTFYPAKMAGQLQAAKALRYE